MGARWRLAALLVLGWLGSPALHAQEDLAQAIRVRKALYESEERYFSPTGLPEGPLPFL